jgi:hypothetical protein
MLRDSRVGRIFEGSSEIMHLIMAREALDTHFKLVMPIMKPKKGQKAGKTALIMKALKFYASWYPKLWLPAGAHFNVKYLSATNQEHLRYVARNSKKLARRIFHTMAKFGPKLETEQLLLANFVNIGVDLFTMAASLAYAEMHLGRNLGEESPQELADLYCKNARERIEANFHSVKKNHYSTFSKVAASFMGGKYRWLCTDIVDNYPPKYRQAPLAESEIEPTLREPVSAK